MSKTSKAKTKTSNLQAKRARKSANKAYFASLRAAGKNTKSVRSVRAGKKSRKVATISHPNGACGNPACARCFPYLDRVFLWKRPKKKLIFVINN
jgi:hypothetical protein